METELDTFIGACPEAARLNVRSAAHAWTSGGGTATIGKLTIRLTAGTPSFTAATIHGPRGDALAPRLEFSRSRLEQQGVDWVHWSDDFTDLVRHGFDAMAKFPTLQFDDDVTPGEMARLVVGIRDLAAAVSK